MAKKNEKTTAPARKYVPRKKVPFELELDREDHVELLEHIKRLKKDRSFRPTVIDGLKLMRDLNKRRSDVLFELFPWMREIMDAEIRAGIAEGLAAAQRKGDDPSGGESGDMTARMERIEQLLIQNTVPAGLLMAAKDSFHEQHTGMMKPLDPDAVEIAVRASAIDPRYEARIGSAKMSNKLDKLPPEIIEYGIKMGRIPSSYKPKETAKPADSTLPILPAIAAAELEKPKKKGFSFGAKVQSLG